MTTIHTCQCQICRDHRRWLAALNPPATEEAALVLDEILGRLAEAETAAVYYRMKYEGTWDRHAEGK